MAILETVTEMFASRNRNAALISGLLFFTGWWVLIDAMAVDHKYQITTGYVFIGIFGTISFFMVNVMSNARISDDYPEPARGIAKIWLLVGFVMGFAAIITAVWVMIDDFLNNKDKSNWLGVALLVQNVFILVGSLVYKFYREEDE